MICNVCGQDITNNTATVCPHCNVNLSEKNQSQEQPIDAEIVPYESSVRQDRDSAYIITPKVVNSESHNSNNFNNSSNSGFGRFVYSANTGHGANSLFFENGCFSILITLALAISCAIQFGVLAGIGFLVFSGIGSILTFFLGVKRMMTNKTFNPWFARIISWACAYLLIIWLAD